MRRNAHGYSGAVDRATAVADGQVPATGCACFTGDDYWTCDPAHAGVGKTTPDTATWVNGLFEELGAILDLGNVASPTGVTPSSLDNTQCSQVLGPVRAIHSSAADTGVVDTVHQCAVIASGLSRARGTAPNTRVAIAGCYGVVAATTAQNSGAVGSQASALSGGVSGLLAAYDCEAATPGGEASTACVASQLAKATKGASCVIASIGAANRTDVVASGAASAIVASAGTAAAPTQASGARSAVIASSSAVVSAADCAAIACPGGVTVSTGGGAAAVAAINAVVSGTGAAALAAGGAVGNLLTVSGGRAAAIGCSMTAATTVSGANDVMLASAGAAFSPAVAGQQVYGGFGGGCTWRINSQTGAYYGASYNVGGADYAECFPLLSPGESLPPRRLVSALGRAVRLAQPGDRIRGVVSLAPAVLGDMPEDMSHADRAQWCPVALLGQVPVEILGDVLPGDYLVPAADGRGVAIEEPPRTGRPVEVLSVLQPFDAAVGYGVALCLVG